MNQIIYIGVNDLDIDLFEGQFKVPNGMSYNSYIIKSDKIAIMDSVDYSFRYEWLNNIEKSLGNLSPDYLIIQHMEPDHSGSIETFLEKYPNTTIVGNRQIKMMLQGFFPNLEITNYLEVKENDELQLGSATLKFIFAPFVHWPEVMMTYFKEEKAIFTADAFGKFGSLDVSDDWISEARRYYMGIVSIYGLNVQNVLKKLTALDINAIYPLHGPVLNSNISYYFNLYNTWSSYDSESDGVVIAYSSVYGNTKKAALYLGECLEKLGYNDYITFDLARSDKHEVISQSFRYSKLVLASITYNGGIFPDMEEFINGLIERKYQKRKIAIIENGSWAPVAAKIIKEKILKLKDLEVVQEVKIKSSMTDATRAELEQLAENLRN